MKAAIFLEFIGILMHSTTLLMRISDLLLRELIFKLFILSLVEFFFCALKEKPIKFTIYEITFLQFSLHVTLIFVLYLALFIFSFQKNFLLN